MISDQEGLTLSYKNGKDVLPASLLRELQRYIEGELLYIPKNSDRAGWGEMNGSRSELSMRNREICSRYNNGESVLKLTEQYHLTEDSIRKIIRKTTQDLYTSAVNQ
jgi:Mor family transcriptional regulator